MSQSKKTKYKVTKYGFLLLVLATYSLWALFRPLALITPSTKVMQLQSSTLPSKLVWPSTGQAAVGITPSGVLAVHGIQRPLPIASTAKVLTALCVLKKKPLRSDQKGPNIVLTDADVKIFNDYVAGDGSVTPVSAGQSLSEYQMLQAVLLPSANNIADSLAIWAFGSLANYSTFANGYIRQLGLTNTHVGSDASGYDPTTVSTAHDLVLLGEAAMQEPVLAAIVSQKSAELPYVGSIYNVNKLLGTNNIVGIKTGNTDQAGGVFLGAKSVEVGGKQLVIISAVVGSTDLYAAMTTSVPLLASAKENFASTTVLKAKSVVGHYSAPWGAEASASTLKSLDAVAWKGSTVPTEVMLQPVSGNAKPGQIVGTITVPASTVSAVQKVPVVLDFALSKPSAWWRLTHPTD